jgi:hypothetical protein
MSLFILSRLDNKVIIPVAETKNESYERRISFNKSKWKNQRQRRD